MRTVADYWTDFEPVLTGTEHEVQQMRTVFYVGFMAAIDAGEDMAAEAKANDDVGATIMGRLRAECFAYLTADTVRRLTKGPLR